MNRVTCAACAHFHPWPDNPAVAMGRCGVGREPMPPEPGLWPKAERICPCFRKKESSP
jgi:hypothetical protein